jgi:hypothetical protein
MRVFAKPSKLVMAGELSNLVRKQWLDAEEARNVATVVQLLGEAYIYPKDLSAKRRAIALAMIVATTKPGIERLGRAGCMKLMGATADFANLNREMRFFNDLKVVIGFR